MSDQNPSVDLELERRLIAAPMCTVADKHGAERWDLICGICYTPVMFFDRNNMFMYMLYDQLIKEGRDITPMSVMAIAGETDWKQLLKNCQRLRSMKDLGLHSDKRRWQMINEPWKVFKDMRGDSVLDCIGGPSYLVDSGLFNIRSLKDVKSGAFRIRELWQKRQQINIFRDSVTEAEKPAAKRSDLAVKSITAIQELENTFDPSKFAGEMIADYMLADDYKRETCAQWPLKVMIMDQAMPLKAGRVYVLGALQSRGKTSLGTDIIRETVKWDKTPRGGVLFFSLEMTSDEILMLMMAQTVGATFEAIENKTLDQSQLHMIQCLADEWKKREQLLVNDKPQTIESMITAIRLHATKHDLKTVVIDHIHIIDKSKGNIDQIDHLGHITRQLKMLAKELNICIIELAMLNRGTNRSGHSKFGSARGDLEPRMSDLKGSSCIESDADCVILIWWNGASAAEGEKSIDLIIGKNRTGATKSIPVTFHAASGQTFSYRDIGGDEHE